MSETTSQPNTFVRLLELRGEFQALHEEMRAFLRAEGVTFPQGDVEEFHASRPTFHPKMREIADRMSNKRDEIQNEVRMILSVWLELPDDLVDAFNYMFTLDVLDTRLKLREERQKQGGLARTRSI